MTMRKKGVRGWPEQTGRVPTTRVENGPEQTGRANLRAGRFELIRRLDTYRHSSDPVPYRFPANEIPDDYNVMYQLDRIDVDSILEALNDFSYRYGKPSLVMVRPDYGFDGLQVQIR